MAHYLESAKEGGCQLAEMMGIKQDEQARGSLRSRHKSFVGKREPAEAF